MGYSLEKKNGLINKIINKITNFFRHEPQKYLLAPGESLEIQGNMPIRPAVTIFNKIGYTLSNRISKTIEKMKPKKINQPEIYSESPAIIHNPKKFSKQKHKSPPLLGIKSFVPENISIIKPENVQASATLTPGKRITISTEYIDPKTSTQKDNPTSFYEVPDFNQRYKTAKQNNDSISNNPNLNIDNELSK